MCGGSRAPVQSYWVELAEDPAARSRRKAADGPATTVAVEDRSASRDAADPRNTSYPNFDARQGDKVSAGLGQDTLSSCNADEDGIAGGGSRRAPPPSAAEAAFASKVRWEGAQPEPTALPWRVLLPRGSEGTLLPRCAAAVIPLGKDSWRGATVLYCSECPILSSPRWREHESWVAKGLEGGFKPLWLLQPLRH